MLPNVLPKMELAKKIPLHSPMVGEPKSEKLSERTRVSLKVFFADFLPGLEGYQNKLHAKVAGVIIFAAN